MTQFIIKTKAYAAIEAKYACQHEHRELRLRTIAGGRQAYYRQCVRCGHAGMAIGKRAASAELQGFEASAFDGDLEHKWRARKHAEYVTTYDGIAPELRAEYEAYLASPEWAEKRTSVLRKADWICQCCEHFKATEVHHITYARIGREANSDLMAVCSFCHGLIHGKHAA